MKQRAKGLTCTSEECTEPVRCKGLCNKHYHVLKNSRKPQNLCACGCGETTIHTFVWGHQTRMLSSEEQARRGRMNNGDSQRERGSGNWYRKVRGRHEHRIVMEILVGRPLTYDDVVHHIDGDVRNNHPSNLELTDREQHIRHHLPEMIAARKAKLGR